jgi:acyl-coenzyme A synthetase/AMP-(fatty) acid ligase
MLFETFARHESRTAVIHEGERWTFARLDAESRKLASGMRALGVKKRDRVAIFSHNNPKLLAATVACFRLGAIATLIRPGQAGPPAVAYMTRLGVRVLIGDTECLDKVKPHVSALDEPLHVIAMHDAVDKVAFPRSDTWKSVVDGGTWDGIDVGDDDTVLIFHTSGSTALPKPVCHSWAAIHAGMKAEAEFWRFDANDVAALFIDMTHSYGLHTIALPVLGEGGALITIPKFVPPDTAAAIARERATVTGAGPGYLELLAEAALGKGHDYSSLRLVMGGGDKISERLHRHFKEALGIPITEIWGATEAGCALANRTAGPTGSLGTTLPGCKARVVDPETGKDVPEGTWGELWITSNYLCSGYWDDRQPQPFATFETHGETWIRTGDTVHRGEGGHLYFIGRRSLVLKRGGVFVSPVEIEATLGRHPGVQDVLVLGRPHDVWGEEPVAYILPKGELVLSDILAFAEDSLAVSSRPVEYFRVASLEHDALGKLVRKRPADPVRLA